MAVFSSVSPIVQPISSVCLADESYNNKYAVSVDGVSPIFSPLLSMIFVCVLISAFRLHNSPRAVSESLMPGSMPLV